MSRAVLRTLSLLAAAVLVLTGCKLDVDITARMEADGSGAVIVQVTADPALTAALPPGSELLSVEDLRAQGWVVQGPVPTEDGGVRVTLSRTTDTITELSAALAAIGPPLQVEAIERRAEGDADLTSRIINRFQLSAMLPEGATAAGFGAFSDPDLNSVMGGVPFGTEIAASGATPASAIDLRLRIEAPGEITDHSGEVIPAADGRPSVQWSIPLDGSTTEISLTTEQRPEGSRWAGAVSQVLLGALVLWGFLSIGFIAFVVIARRRRSRRRRTRARSTAAR